MLAVGHGDLDIELPPPAFIPRPRRRSAGPAQSQLAEPAVPAPGVVTVQFTQRDPSEAGRRVQDDQDSGVALDGGNAAQDDRPVWVPREGQCVAALDDPGGGDQRERQIRLPSS
jgi:hypothetical protein